MSPYHFNERKTNKLFLESQFPYLSVVLGVGFI